MEWCDIIHGKPVIKRKKEEEDGFEVSVGVCQCHSTFCSKKVNKFLAKILSKVCKNISSSFMLYMSVFSFYEKFQRNKLKRRHYLLPHLPPSSNLPTNIYFYLFFFSFSIPCCQSTMLWKIALLFIFFRFNTQLLFGSQGKGKSTDFQPSKK